MTVKIVMKAKASTESSVHSIINDRNVSETNSVDICESQDIIKVLKKLSPKMAQESTTFLVLNKKGNFNCYCSYAQLT